MVNGDMPLSDLLVLDLTRARSGPTSVRQLADWGADVISIEEPVDDANDSLGGARDGFDFQNLHRNKRSITLNLKEPGAKEVFFKLAARADVIIENYRPDVKRRLGIDYEAVKAINPRIIYGSISGFGQTGPYANRPGYDQIAQGMGGLMSVTGLPGQGPVRVGIPIADLTSGIFLAMGVLVALHQRERTGVGQWVHTSLLEAQIAMLDFQGSRWLIGKEVPPQAGNDHPTSIPTGVYETADGAMNIAASGDHMFRRLCDTIGGQHLLGDPEFKTGRDRSRNRQRLHEELTKCFKARSTFEWVDALNEAGVPCGPIYSIDQTFNDPQVRHLGMARPLKHPRLGDIEVVGQAVNLEGTGGKPSVRLPSPDRGQHTQEVLQSLGYDAAGIAALKQAKAI